MNISMEGVLGLPPRSDQPEAGLFDSVNYRAAQRYREAEEREAEEARQREAQRARLLDVRRGRERQEATLRRRKGIVSRVLRILGLAAAWGGIVWAATAGILPFGWAAQAQIFLAAGLGWQWKGLWDLAWGRR